MTQLTNEALLGQLTALLREVFEGSEEAWTYVLDQGAEVALFGTLDKVSAASASREVGGSSVAAQAHHVLFGVRASVAWIRGERVKHDWSRSWTVRGVDDPAWRQLRDDLWASYGDLRQAIEAHATTGGEALGGAVGAIAHVAYHLGAIRQKLAILHAGGASNHPPPP